MHNINSISGRVFAVLLCIMLFCTCDHLLAQEYRGAEYRTKENYLYGRFEVRYIPAHREGVVSSFFTYRDPDSISTDWNEIDIEFVGRYSNIIQFNTITPGQTSHIRSNFLDFDPYIDYNNYGFEWTPDYVAWFVNGEEVYRQTGEHVATLKWPTNIMMNIWNPIWTNWVGTWDENALPAFSKYDWIKYSSYTPSAGDYGSDNNFTLQWIDSLNSSDQERWEFATHGFGGNQAKFFPSNGVFEDGKMILCLTDKVDTGYVDLKKPEVKWARENFDNSLTVQFSEEVDRQSAETSGNYNIANVEITEAKLSDDKKTVRLQMSNYNKDNNYSIIVLNVKDDSPFQNTIDLKGITIDKINELEFPVKINVGGDSFNDYLADQEWSEKVEYGYWAGDVHLWTQRGDIPNHDDDEIFKSEREGLTTYKIRVQNGIYNISLLFAEYDETTEADRIFDIVVENELLSDNLDIFSVAGKDLAYSFEASVNVDDEIIDIYFPEEVDSAFVNGIIIDQISTNVEGINFGNNLDQFELHQNYPNPFNPKTKISYRVNKLSQISLEVYDAIGNNVKRINDGIKSPGSYNIVFEASSLTSGIYFYRLMANGIKVATKKMVVLK